MDKGIRPTFLDGLTSVDELLKENTHVLRELRSLLEREEVRETRTIYFTYPDDGTLATLQTGTTVLNFKVGTIEDVDHNFTNMGHSLDSDGRDWLRSFFVNSDKNITVQPNDYDKIPATEEKDAIGLYQEFTKLKITCTEETKVFVACCTSPEAVVRLISNASVLTDPIDVFGHRVYIGAAELATRLGSTNTFERRGTTMWSDNFESDTSKWIITGTGTGYSVLRSIEHARNLNYTMKLITGNAEDDYAQMAAALPMPVARKMGFEFSFALGSDIKYLEFYSYPQNGTHVHIVLARFYPQTDTLKVYDEASNAVTITDTLRLKEHDYIFHQAKVVFDLDDGKWMRMFIDQHEYNISAYSIEEQVNTEVPLYYVRIKLVNNASGNHYAYIDNVIVTQGEPV